MLPEAVERRVSRYLREVDRGLPGAVEGFYVVGSTALRAFQPGRSDIDFVAVVGRRLDDAEVGRLCGIQRSRYAADLCAAVAHPPWRWPLTCNGVYVEWADLGRSPLTVRPAASHNSWRFIAGAGFDVNPVTWRVLSKRGIAVRGPAPGSLGVHDDNAELRRWCRRNLDTYWQSWAWAVLRRARPGLMQRAAWGVLGAPRLHYTIRTGEIISKEEAGEYAFTTFDGRWRPLIEEALAYWRGELRSGPFRLARSRLREAARFVLEVVESADAAS